MRAKGFRHRSGRGAHSRRPETNIAKGSGDSHEQGLDGTVFQVYTLDSLDRRLFHGEYMAAARGKEQIQ
jgi:hypothetical protein